MQLSVTAGSALTSSRSTLGAFACAEARAPRPGAWNKPLTLSQAAVAEWLALSLASDAGAGRSTVPLGPPAVDVLVEMPTAASPEHSRVVGFHVEKVQGSYSGVERLIEEVAGGRDRDLRALQVCAGPFREGRSPQRRRAGR